MRTRLMAFAAVLSIAVICAGAATRRRPTTAPADARVGMITAISQDKSKPGAFTITIAMRQGRTTESVEIAGDSATQVVIADQPAKAEDLKVGYRVTVNPATGPAKRITVPKGRAR